MGTLEYLGEFASRLAVDVSVPPQLSEAQAIKQVELEQTVTDFGTSLIVWQLILFFILGKALNSMWILVNAL